MTPAVDRRSRAAASMAAALLLCLPSPCRAAPRTAWTADAPLAAAVRRAAAHKQYLLLRIGRRDCAACLALGRALQDKAVARQVSRYAALVYDADSGEGPDVAQRYNVVAFPTLLLLGTDGNEIGRISAPDGHAALAARLAALEERSATLDALEQLLARVPSDLRLRLRIGRAWALRGDRRRALHHLDAVVAADPANRQGLASRALWIKGRWLLLASLGQRDQALATLAELRRRFPRSPAAAKASALLATITKR